MTTDMHDFPARGTAVAGLRPPATIVIPHLLHRLAAAVGTRWRRRRQGACAARYDLADPKAAEHAIVRDALSGAVEYRRWTAPNGVLLVRHGVAQVAGVTVRLGHGGSLGTSTCVKVNGVDMSYESSQRFDAARVAAAVLDGRDLRAGAAPAARRPPRVGAAG